MIFFLIGAPLGAIIRKGGLGLPVVVSIIFFVIYYIISLSGENWPRKVAGKPCTASGSRRSSLRRSPYT